MTIKQIIEANRLADYEGKLSVLLAIHCAPILKDGKASNILTVSCYDVPLIRNILEQTRICSTVLGVRQSRVLLFLYRRDRLSEYLARKEHAAFLRLLGYQGDDIDEKIRELSGRVADYQNKKCPFPHEIGLFLEYPLWDVQGYVENQGKNFLISGYWKVYRYAGDAKRRFAEFDENRETALRELLKGRAIREIAL